MAIKEVATGASDLQDGFESDRMTVAVPTELSWSFYHMNFVVSSPSPHAPLWSVFGMGIIV